MKILRKKTTIGISIIIIVTIIFFILETKLNFTQVSNLNNLRQSLISFGVWSPMIYFIIMAMAIVISPIPSLPLAVVSGMIWGPILGTIYSLIGGLIGACISFTIARTLGREAVVKLLKKDISFCDRCTEKTITWIILISRLFPFFQFDIVSYGAGLTNIRLTNFAIATFVGMIPMTYLFTAFGETLVIGKTLSIILSLGLILSMFGVPMMIKRYKLFGSRIKIDDVR